MNIYGKTDIGLRRKSNQDAFSYGIVSGRALWAVVCDGMGGAKGGDIASEIAVQSVTEQMNQGLREGLDDNALRQLLASAVESANRAIFGRGLQEPALSEMGTTIVLAAMSGERACIAHVGDSRAYLISPKACTQLTTDHSMVQMMVENGTLTEEEAKTHPNKNVITRALGISMGVEIDFRSYTQSDGEILLLCSDGLSNFVEPGEMARLVLENERRLVPEILVNRANQNGGGDNITAVVIGQ